jgi:hypothetical protein
LCGGVVRPHTDQAAMAKLNDDQRRALKMLAHQDGCAEAALLADGFSIDQLAGLVVQGCAVMQRRRVDISGRMRTVVWIQITEFGRRAIGCSGSLQRSKAHEIEGTVALFGLVNIDEVAGLLPAR